MGEFEWDKSKGTIPNGTISMEHVQWENSHGRLTNPKEQFQTEIPKGKFKGKVPKGHI